MRRVNSRGKGSNERRELVKNLKHRGIESTNERRRDDAKQNSEYEARWRQMTEEEWTYYDNSSLADE